MSHTEDSNHRRGRPTIEDVAAEAGVSVATVSRALRGLPNVAASTRERVQQIARAMDYRANPAATRLATGRTHAIGIAVPLVNSWYFSHVVAGVEAVCAEAGYDTIVTSVTSHEHRARLIDDSGAVHSRVDGIVLIDVAYSSDELEKLAALGTDVVTIGATSDLFPSVGVDNVEMARLATRHLIELGHERIGVIEGQRVDPFEFVVPGDRMRGYEQAHRDAGLDIDPDLREPGNFTIQGGRDALAALLRRPRPPTAVFAMSDEMAFGALAGARESGLEIPGDLSVVGVDDHELSSVVGLTTVRQDVEGYGARAARLLVERLAGGERTPRRIDVGFHLIVRDTTAPPRG